MNELSASSLTVWHEGAEGPIPIAKNVDLGVPGGSILGIVGPNGCGKTTLLRALAGLHDSKSGSVRMNGEPVRGNRLSFVSQNFRQGFFPWASLRRHLALNIDTGSLGDPTPQERIAAAADAMEVHVDLGLRPHQASGGMLQQVNLVLLTARSTPLLFADEPFSALDISVASRLRRNFRKFVLDRQSIAILVLHDPVEILELCDRVLIIPDKPFSTRADSGCIYAEFVDRKIEAGGIADEKAGASFAAAMKRILDA